MSLHNLFRVTNGLIQMDMEIKRISTFHEESSRTGKNHGEIAIDHTFKIAHIRRYIILFIIMTWKNNN